MQTISVRDKLRNMEQFKDITYYYRELGRYIFNGYVPHDAVTKYPSQFHRYSDFSDMLWKGKRIPRKSMNVPTAISGYLVKQIYSEYPEITLQDERQNEVLQDILDSNNFSRLEKESFEAQLHIGDRIVKPYIKNGKVRFDWVTGDKFFATKVDNYEIVSGIFMTTKTVKEGKKSIYYTRVEWHYDLEELMTKEDKDAGKTVSGRGIKYEVYKSDDLNNRFKTTAWDAMSSIFGQQVENQNEIFPDLDRPTFVYMKNPLKNNKDIQEPRGIGIFMNTLDSIISCDEAFHAKSTDNVYGQMQKLVPEIATESVWDTRTEGYIRHHNPNDPAIMVYRTNDLTDAMPREFAPALRTGSHVHSINTDLDVVSTNVGISAGTLRYDGKSMVTATQVLTEKSETARTIKLFEQETERGIKDLLMLVKYYFNRFIYPNFFTFEDNDDIEVNWYDNVIMDDEDKLQRMKMDASDGTIAKWRYIAKAYGISEEEAREWAVEAVQEQMALYPTDEMYDDTPEGDMVDEETDQEQEV